MTPGARVAAAIEVLDAALAGAPAERELTSWARRSRFAGSGDRAAVRDHVYGALRRRRSLAALAGQKDDAATGRGLMLGACFADGIEPATLFTGQGHAPAPPSPQESASRLIDDPLAALDCPAWLADDLRASLGAGFAPVMAALRHRAPVHLRANLARTDRDGARAALSTAGIECRDHPLSPSALEVVSGARRVQSSGPYADGLVELQDASSQAIVDALPLPEGGRVLDLCAGGGGKALAMAARAPGLAISAHDIDPGRMADLPARAARAGAALRLVDPGALPDQPPFDGVLADAPCSGSGAWRRQPQARWTLDADRLSRLVATQDGVLDTAAGHVAPGGWLAYATCSLLRRENEDRVAAFLARHAGWQVARQLRLDPRQGGDGFFLSLLRRT